MTASTAFDVACVFAPVVSAGTMLLKSPLFMLINYLMIDLMFLKRVQK